MIISRNQSVSIHFSQLIGCFVYCCLLYIICSEKCLKKLDLSDEQLKIQRNSVYNNTKQRKAANPHTRKPDTNCQIMINTILKSFMT